MKNDSKKDIICLNKDFLTKNHQGGLQSSSFAMSGVISDETQLKAIQRYLTKLNPEVGRLFQCAYNGGLGVGKADVRFIKSPLSHNTLSTMMAKLSEEAGLSQRYTNYCVRITVISRL